MKRVRIYQTGGPEVMRVEPFEPPQPGPGEALLRIRSAGINPVDTYLRAGLQGYTPKLPYTPGMDGAGEILASGNGVSGFKTGQRVYCAGSISGTYAEAALCRADQLHPLPGKLSFEQGACIGVPYGTAYRALFRVAEAQKGEMVLVHGASGGVGLAAAQLARAAGLTVIGTAGSETGRKLVAAQGAVPLNHGDPGHFEQALKATGGRGVPIILEMLADKNLGEDLKILAPEGRVVVIGSRGEVTITPRELMARDSSIRGMSLLRVPPEELRQIHAALGKGFSDGTLQPVVAQSFRLEEAAQAHRQALAGPARGNLVLACANG
ncbi:MAG: quinone oxidoreductase [Candidatus Omnitrophica bacterium CG11_big_fil_rev_8_21_14_0_20_64_10]|nr:MAG: quinone oxidoreductase [Candidatus Omnitrophica bacterium CG11_big_fil_rev_8_21_14_0_20_64_10]